MVTFLGSKYHYFRFSSLKHDSSYKIYGTKKQKKILVSKTFYKILSSLAYNWGTFSDSLGSRDKERDFLTKASSLDKTFLRILDPEMPSFVDSGQNVIPDRVSVSMWRKQVKGLYIDAYKLIYEISNGDLSEIYLRFTCDLLDICLRFTLDSKA